MGFKMNTSDYLSDTTFLTPVQKAILKASSWVEHSNGVFYQSPYDGQFYSWRKALTIQRRNMAGE